MPRNSRCRRYGRSKRIAKNDQKLGTLRNRATSDAGWMISAGRTGGANLVVGRSLEIPAVARRWLTQTDQFLGQGRHGAIAQRALRSPCYRGRCPPDCKSRRHVVNKSLTIVLPVHNGEARLRSCVREILEVASDLTSAFGILIVDDGSTDSTFEVAAELSARYPQVSVRRHRYHRGLGPTIDYVQRHVRSDAVMLHDGVTPIDANQMRNEWRRWIAGSQNSARSVDPITSQSDICDFANLPAIHAAMERAHGRMIGFQLVAPIQTNCEELIEDRDPARSSRTDATPGERPGIGRLPPLPRPKFLQAIAEFAFGE